MKIVINRCYGGFGLSKEAMLRYAEIKGMDLYVLENPRRPSICIPMFIKIPLSDFFDYEKDNLVVCTDENYSEHAAKTNDLWKALSAEDKQRYNDQFFSDSDIERDDPALVQAVEELCSVVNDVYIDRASGYHASLAVVEIPDDVKWEINDYDGMEHAAEIHRCWY